DLRHPREKLGRRAIVDRHDHDTAQQTAPEGDDPFRPVLAPEEDGVALPYAAIVERGREPARGARDVRIREAPAAKPIVVHEELAVREREIVEKVNERAADHE